MALVSVPGSMLVPIGVGWNETRDSAAAFLAAPILDAANEAVIFVGQIITSDGASHTIDTSGSSSIGWQSGATTFANAGTTCVVGVAAVDTATGPAVRAVNSSDVITFDVSAVFTGGGGGVTATAWQTSVPTTGTKTIANGDFVAVAIQLTARGGADVIRPQGFSTERQHRPVVTTFLGGSYAATGSAPNIMITFSDGARGHFYGSSAAAAITVRTWNSGSAQAEYGQLFQMPFGMKVSGLYGWVDPDNNFDMVLYSDPLGTPVAEKTVSIDANTSSNAAGARMVVMFDTPVIIKPNQPIVAAFKPGASNISTYYKTFNNAAHRFADAYGLTGYGVQRTSGAFSDVNSSLDNYYIGLMASALENPVAPTYHIGI